MAGDLNAKRVIINYQGGSFEMALGNLKGLLGESFASDATKGVETTTSVKTHQRTRVIGGGSKTINSYSYDYLKFPGAANGQSAGGEEVAVWWEGSNGKWISRVAGPLWRFSDYLSKTSEINVWFKNAGGKTFGPYNKNA